MKILVVGPNSIHVSSFIKALNSSGLVPDLLVEEKCDFQEVGTEYEMSFRKVGIFNFRSLERKLLKIIEEIDPTVVHIHQINRVAYFVAKVASKRNIPVITTAWGSDVLVVPKANPIYKYLVRKTIERSRIVTADSMEMIAAMRLLIESETKYRLLQYGIDRIQAQVKENIIYSNRLHKELYRIDQIIEYAADFFKVHDDWKLIIGAVGSMSDQLKERVSALNLESKVEFVGWLDKVDNQHWYSKARIYMSIPKHDGTAVSLLEAMSAGCVPIVSDIEVSREWISDGENGIIEHTGENPLFKAIQLDAAHCAEMNSRIIQERALREMCTAQFINFYKEIAAN
jgi:L-malate glycosyltransferase